jgi:predicted DsbA family dithiol-disulfide isomerase
MTKHPGACFQAKAALCAETQERGPPFSDRLFDEGLTAYAPIAGLARSLGLDVEVFDRCLGVQDTAERLRQSIDEANAAGVRATPTLFANGQRHVGRLGPNDLRCLMSASSSAAGSKGAIR